MSEYSDPGPPVFAVFEHFEFVRRFYLFVEAGFNDANPIGCDPPSVSETPQGARCQILIVGRVHEDEVVGLRRPDRLKAIASENLRSVLFLERGDVAAAKIDCGFAVVQEGNVSSAPAEGFQPACARAAKRVEYSGIRQDGKSAIAQPPVFQNVEYGFPNAIRRRPDVCSVGSLDVAAFMPAGDDSHSKSLSRFDP